MKARTHLASLFIVLGAASIAASASGCGSSNGAADGPGGGTLDPGAPGDPPGGGGGGGDAAVASDGASGSDAGASPDAATGDDAAPGDDGGADAAPDARVLTAKALAYDPQGRLIGEYDEQGKPLQELVYLEGRLVAIVRAGTAYAVQTDHAGTPRSVHLATAAVVDAGSDGAADDAGGADAAPPAATQATVWRWEPEPFGTTAPDEDPDGDGARFVLDERYPGQRFDSVSGLFQNHHRNYAPELGRYVETDPIGLRGGPNLYAYAFANPLLFVDPSGLRVRICYKPVEHPVLKVFTLGFGSHYWVQTDSYSGGFVGGAVGDHQFEYDASTVCYDVPNVDEDCVNAKIKPQDHPMPWTPFFTCKDFAKGVTNGCRTDLPPDTFFHGAP